MASPLGAFSRSTFIDGLGFTPDRFQLDAFDVVDEGSSVVVAAPTGSGKTLVATYAIDKAIAEENRVFYTTPIKALSNQKYHEMVERLGAGNVGLLTGDNAVNPSAPVVIMTTEVLRNMLYAGADFTGLKQVILDEVHYLQDPYRGSVWEEVIIHLPRPIGLVCLSATVSNADELTEWIDTIRGNTELVVELQRPVELESSYVVGERSSSHLHMVKTLNRGKPNVKAVRFDNEISRGKSKRSGPARRRKWKTPSPLDVTLLLNEKRMLPAIHFIFSRAGCEEAAAVVTRSGFSATTEEERRQIRLIIESKTAGLSPQDHEVLNVEQFQRGLEAGVASHHAGMIPPLKEAVEQCFAAGLTKIVFATETLALGINMPARTVVLDKLTKFTGEHHEFLTPAQYTQLIGRAGRRGIDNVGHSVVLWSPFVQFEQISNLAMSRDFELTSSFRPTYNMAANLVRRFEPDQARDLLNQSFAQFRSDSTVVRTEDRRKRLLEREKQIRGRIEAEFGPLDSIRAALTVKKSHSADLQAISFALTQLVPGEVIRLSGDDLPTMAVVVAVAFRKGGRIKATVVDSEADACMLRPADLDQVPDVVGRVALPEPYVPNSVSFQFEAAQQLSRLRITGKKKGRSKGKQQSKNSPKPLYNMASEVPQKARRSIQRLERIEKDIAKLSSVNGSGHTLSAQFESVLGLLATRSYVDGWELTSGGQRLARLYHECDLLIVDCLEAKLFDGLGPSELAGLLSVFVFSDRRRDHRGEVWFPTGDLKRRYNDIAGLGMRLAIDENEAGLPGTRQTDPGFVGVAHAWASGGDIDDVLLDEEIPAGDFIKTIKQLIDLLNQIASLASDEATVSSARQASELLFRDLVSVSSTLDVASEPDEESKGHE